MAINQSKINDPRMWERWGLSGATGQTNKIGSGEPDAKEKKLEELRNLMRRGNVDVGQLINPSTSTRRRIDYPRYIDLNSGGFIIVQPRG